MNFLLSMLFEKNSITRRKVQPHLEKMLDRQLKSTTDARCVFDLRVKCVSKTPTRRGDLRAFNHPGKGSFRM